MPSQKTASPAEPARHVQLADNRKARFDYQIESRLEAGIALRGPEIRSLRAGDANPRAGYARTENGEVSLPNVHTPPRPEPMTTISSAVRIVERRCAMTKEVPP